MGGEPLVEVKPGCEVSQHSTQGKPGRGGGITNDLASGGFFFAAGAAFWTLSRDLAMGTSSQPGPGYLPTILGVLLMILGAGIVARDWVAATKSEAVVRPAFRPFLAALGIFAFAVMIEPAGFIITASVLVALGLAACGRFRVPELLALGVVLVGVNILIFVIGLGQRIPLLP